LEVPLVAGPLGNSLVRLRDRAAGAAAANIVVGEGMAKLLRTRGTAPERIHVIANWCDDDAIQPVSPDENLLRQEWGLADRFVVGYSGNLGRGHEYKTVLDAARRLRDVCRVVFLFIGGGSGLQELARRVHDEGLQAQFRFLPYQDRARLGFSLGVADVHWLSLRPQLEGLMVPSKFYGIAAAGRPVIAVTSPNDEIADLVRRHNCGAVVAPGDGIALAEAVCRLAENPPLRTEMGRQARAMLDAHFTRRHAFARWERLLETIE
ncbi:MAG TPA: glycosyltransferase family 4 protein, partial [Stellaceae bacterium]|nr:glycosyltransferase family 4 protein [Stellaceae bacterium]